MSVKRVELTAFDMAQRFVGTKEIGGDTDNPQILSFLKLDNSWPEHDEVPWCSGFVNYICWLLRLPRSKSLRARSWLTVGRAIRLDEAEPGDVIVLKRGGGDQPGPEVIEAPGHVGFFAGFDTVAAEWVQVLGGNQSDGVNVREYSTERLLGVRRL